MEYWIKKSRARALAAFAGAVKTEDDFGVVMRAVKEQREEMLTREPKHRPFAETWLSGKRFNDEPTIESIPSW